MEFKIDTKDLYVVITPVSSHMDVNMTDALCQKCTELTESGSQNFIIDLQNCLEAAKESFAALISLHEDCYSNEQSLVFTNVQPAVLSAFKDEELDMALNIAPIMAEAVDIISMEVLERDLFKEE